MAIIYMVKHEYEVDGGFGDSVYVEDVIAVCLEKKDAEAIVETYSKPHIYLEPYDSLSCGSLTIEEKKTTTFAEFVSDNNKKDCWWLINNVLVEEEED